MSQNTTIQDDSQFVWVTTGKPTITRDPDILSEDEIKNLGIPEEKPSK